MSGPTETESGSTELSSAKITRTQRRNRNKFWTWFLKSGSTKFRQSYGRDYDETREEDRYLIGELWDYDKMSWNLMQHGRYIGVSDVSRSVENSERSTPITTKFHERYETKQSLQRSAANARPCSYPPSPFRCTSYTADRSGIIGGKREIVDKFNFFYCQRNDFSTLMLGFLAISPYCTASFNGSVLVYPAEIAITQFTLAKGTTYSWSTLIDFDPNPLCGSGCTFNDRRAIERNAALLDVSSKHSMGRTPAEVWRMLMTRKSGVNLFVCDAEEMYIVDRALLFLASTVGRDQVPIYEEIVSQMVAAQDLVAGLAVRHYEAVKVPLPEFLTDESIYQEFKMLGESCKCCDYHESKPPNHSSRRHCAVAKTGFLVDTICKLFFSANLFNFRSIYSSESHRIESIVSDDVPEDLTISISTDDVPHNEVSEARYRALGRSTEYSQRSPYTLHYEVVPSKDCPFMRRRKLDVDLKDAISRLLGSSISIDIN